MNSIQVIKYKYTIAYVAENTDLNWLEEKKRIRRFLRDPAGNIWTDAMILRIYNDIQREIQQKTGILEDVQAVRVPPVYDMSYLFDWEWVFLPSGNQYYYRALKYYEQSDEAYCYRFEPQVRAEITSTADDQGEHCTQPWELFINDNPGDLILLRLPYGFHKAKFVAWDKKPIDYIDRKKISSDDPTWQTRMGEPQWYWRPDKLDDVFCLYPQASSPTWDDIQTSYEEADYVFSYSWEDTDYITGTGRSFTRNFDSTTEYIFNWEYDHLESGSTDANDEVAMRCMWLFEVENSPGDVYTGMVLYTDSEDVNRETGTIVDSAEWLFNQDLGITTDTVTADDNVLFIFEKNPTDLESLSDQSDFPRFLRKYIEYGVLERAYMADTDGQIQSLRDYWKLRKDLGIKAIKKFMSVRKQDRDYRLTTKGVPGFRTVRQPRLPDAYPAVW